MHPFSLNIHGRLLEYSRPLVMGIVNATPDSFYAASRADGPESIRARVTDMLSEGADIIDIGACSTRPGSLPASASEEAKRLFPALAAARETAPDAVISVDTFRPEIAEEAVSVYGADIINDVSGGNDEMYRVAADLKVPYILTHNAPVEHPTRDVLSFFGERISRLKLMGVNDIILDPGFGFGKDLEQNHILLSVLDTFTVLNLPILVGLSRKSMATLLLEITADQALPATVALNTLALERGAAILRVHDVAAARQTIFVQQYSARHRGR